MASNFASNSSSPGDVGDDFLLKRCHLVTIDRQALQNSLKLKACFFCTEMGAPVGMPGISGLSTMRKRGREIGKDTEEWLKPRECLAAKR